VGDSGLEILHGGVGGDVELGTRISKQIFVFAFDPISLNSILFILCKSIIHNIISYLLVLSIIHSVISYLFCLCCALHISYCYILDRLA